MVASSSNLLLVAASSRQGQVRRGSTKPNDHDLTSDIENRRGYMIGSTNTNNISGINGTNLKDMIMLETVAPMAFASASAASTSTSPTPPSAATKSEGKPRPRPRRKKMASTGVDAMKKMLVTSSSIVVALPESPIMVSRKYEGEQRDDIESVFNNIRSASNRKVLAFDLSVPSMPDMLSMPTLPTPAMNQSRSKQKNEMSHSHNDNDNANAPMKKKKKKQLQMGRRLRQIKKRLSLTKSKTSSSSKQEENKEVCLSLGTSVTTSTSSFGPTSSQKEEDDAVPICDMLTMNMTTTLKPRVRSIFPEEEEMMSIMPVHVLPASPCPLSTTATSTITTHEEERVVVVTTLPFVSFPSKLDQALSVFSLNEGDVDDGDDVDVGVDDETDEWGIFASYDDEDHESEDQTHNYYNHQSKPFSSRSSFTKNNTTNPCFPPRDYLPVVFAATAVGAE